MAGQACWPFITPASISITNTNNLLSPYFQQSRTLSLSLSLQTKTCIYLVPMADLSTLAMARRELEELYLGIPDDSVNLTFGDLANVKQQAAAPLEKRKSGSLDPITETNPKKEADSHLAKLPSLDFSKALAHSNIHQHEHRHIIDNTNGSFHGSRAQRYSHGEDRRRNSPLGRGYSSPSREAGFRSHAVESSRAYDEMSNISGTSVGSVSPYTHGGGGGRRRPGIPHSNICTVCSTYIYICRHRCLV